MIKLKNPELTQRRSKSAARNIPEEDGVFATRAGGARETGVIDNAVAGVIDNAVVLEVLRQLSKLYLKLAGEEAKLYLRLTPKNLMRLLPKKLIKLSN